MFRHASRVAVLVVMLTLSFRGQAQEQISRQADDYYVLLHARSLAGQRKALTAVISAPQTYVRRIQQSLRDYPRLLRTDRVAANRAVYISALVRDPSFPRLLVTTLGNEAVLEECEYPCPVVFALTVQASFAGWSLPSDLNSQLTTVRDLRSSIQNVKHLTRKLESLDHVVQGPSAEKHKKELAGKTEEQLIKMAAQTSESYESRLFAALRLETLVTDDRNRVELYLLALNEIPDASGEYRDAIYQTIYRAELAKAHSESAAPKH